MAWGITEAFMREIGNISLGHIANAAHFLFMSDMASRAAADSAVLAKCAAQVEALRAAVAAEDECVQMSAKSMVTDGIAEADRARDRLFAGYKKAVSGYEGFPDESLAEAARTLSQHIRDYRIDVRSQRDKETGLLMNFVQDLEGRLAPHVAALSLGVFVEKLRQANEELRILTEKRMDERASRVPGAMKAAREASDAAWRELSRHVNARAVIEGEADYAQFIDYANMEIAHFKREVLGVARRRGVKSVADGGEAE